MCVKVARLGKDADVSSSDAMGMIPAGTLLKTEFRAVIPDAPSSDKAQVSRPNVIVLVEIISFFYLSHI